MAILEAEHICKSFSRTEALKDISFSLEKGQALIAKQNYREFVRAYLRYNQSKGRR